MKIAFLAILAGFSFCLSGQSKSENLLYGHLAVNFGIYDGIDFGINLKHKNGFVIKTELLAGRETAQSLPLDYSNRKLHSFVLGNLPSDRVRVFSASIGKYATKKSINWARLGLFVGPSYGYFRKPSNWRWNPGFEKPTHFFDYKYYNKFGLKLSSRAEFIPRRFIGFFIEPSYILFNNETNINTLSFGMMFWKVKSNHH